MSILKKILFSLLLFFIIRTSYSQAFQKGNYDITFGTGIGIYDAVSNDTSEINDNGEINAVKILFPVTANYFFTDKWAIGIAIQYNKILVVPDSLNIYARTVNYGINNKILLMNNPDDNVYFDLCIGSSQFSWRNKKNGYRLTGKGIFYNLGLGIYHYFNNTLGFYINGAISVYQYNTIYNSRKQIITTDEGLAPLFIKLGGINLSAGLCLKF